MEKMIDLLSKKEYEEIMRKLEMAFNFVSNRAHNEYLLKSLIDIGCEKKHFEKAVAYIINTQTRMPVNQSIINAVSIEIGKELNEKKMDDERKSREFYDIDKHKSRMAKDAAICVQRILASDSKKERLALMRTMHEKYPILKLHPFDKTEDYTDYAREADKLERQYNRNIPLWDGKFPIITY